MSIVDYLKSQGKDSSFQSRSKMASDAGIQNFSGTAEQNTQLLKQLQEANKPTPSVVPAVTNQPDVNKQMADFSAGQKVNNAGEEVNVPSQQRVEDFNKQFSTTPDSPIKEGFQDMRNVQSINPKTGEGFDASGKSLGVVDKGIDTKTKEFELKQKEQDSLKNNEQLDIDLKEKTNQKFLGDFNGVMEGGDRKQINAFLTKNRALFNENKEVLIGAVKEYQKAQKTQKTVARLSSLDGKGLYNASLEGDFSQGDDVFNSLDPLKQQEFLAYQKRYIRLDAKDKTKKIVADLQSDDAEEIYNKMAIHNPTYQEKYKEIVLDNKERSDLQSTLSTQHAEIEQERLKLQKLEKQIDKRYPSASEGFKRSVLNKESGALGDKIEELAINYGVTQSQFNMIDADGVAEYEAYVLDAGIEFDTYQQAITTAVNTYKTDKAVMNQKDILKMQYEQADLTLKKNQEFAQTIKTFDSNLRIKEGQYMSNDNGELIHVVGNVSTKVLDSTGTVVATERYQNYQESLQENAYGGYDIIRTYNDGTRPDVSSYDMNGNLVGGTTSLVAGAINEVGATNLLQCGKAVNNYLQNLGGDRIFGDSYKSKTDQINSEVPMMGGVAIWNPNRKDGTYSEYGHVGIITGISSDGKTLEITDWNYAGDEKKQVHKVERSVIEANGGYHLPKGAKKSDEEVVVENIIDSKGNKVGTTKDAEEWAESIYQGDASFSDVPTGLETAVNNNLRTRESKDITEVASTAKLIEDILKHPGMAGLVGSPLGLGNSSWSNLGVGGIFPSVIGSYALPTTDARDFKVLTEQLENKLFLSNIKSMKGMGSLSDAEGKKVSGAAGSLTDYGQSEESYVKMLNRMLDQTNTIYDGLGGVQMEKKQIEAMKNFTIK